MSKLPLVVRRSIRDELEPRIVEAKAKLLKMFGEEYTCEYDVAAVLATLEAAKAEEKGEDFDREEFTRQWYAITPRWIGTYFVELADGLKRLDFNRDEMLKESFLEAVDKRIIRFELLDKLRVANLPKNKNHHYVDIDDGVLRMSSFPASFSLNMSMIAMDIVSKL